MAKAVKKMRNRLKERRAQFDSLRDHQGRKRPGSMKKKAKSASTNKANRRMR